ncbi:hypothetical protein [Proteus mirabilis]|uniref:hypothetical protein n=1 Tax=Proteus mirabilis TaxID=584 RepID=UPI0012EC6C11|nr:hypothetical protein [Proteus mirabilis]ELI8994526.1 hypothetical protein [Proteus mirabilis]MVD51384.1 hypothetical protein [Proteus mirabilis]MVD73693.1 hypothetical protein [Proteus mirabilis]MVF42698.1 hypothetical protein [Proteus mirabilis]QKQ95252.1 hypothetical protein GCE56_06630 [Proteus mirabilis]
MDNDYSWDFSEQFAKEFANFPKDQQDKILEFTEIYEANGLSDFSCYEGKITYSWKGLKTTDDKFVYAYENQLWHYHIGIPEFKSSNPKYKTSDWVLHFQWDKEASQIFLVDMYKHYTQDGVFYLPEPKYLTGKIKKAS